MFLWFSSFCKDFDPFENQKQQAYFGSKESILRLAEQFIVVTDRAKKISSEKDLDKLAGDFEQVLKVSIIVVSAKKEKSCYGMLNPYSKSVHKD